MLENSERQLTYYTSGVGSYVAGARALNRVMQKFDGERNALAYIL